MNAASVAHLEGVLTLGAEAAAQLRIACALASWHATVAVTRVVVTAAGSEVDCVIQVLARREPLRHKRGGPRYSAWAIVPLQLTV